MEIPLSSFIRRTLLSHPSLRTLLLVCALAGSGLLVRADSVFIPSGFEGLTYNVTLQEGITGVSDILFVNETSKGPSWSWPYSFSSGSSSATQVYANFFPAVEATIAVGLVTDLPGDPSGDTTTHLAVFGNFLPDQIGDTFSSLFPDANESALINDLTHVFDSADTPTSTTNAAFSAFVLPFFKDATTDGLLISPGSSFEAVAFSTGQLIGTGTFEVVNTPEPTYVGTLAFLFCGLVALRRRSPN
jgi:hypothetical protein